MRLLPRRSERAERERFFDRAARETELVSARAEGLTFVVSTRDESVGRKLFAAGGRTEFEILRRALEHVPAQGVFVDVGANIGTATLPALAHFERAVAIEPEPFNASLLRANVALNGFDSRVAVHEAACSAAPGEVMLRLAVSKHGGHAVRTVKPGVPSIAVRAVTLDEVLAEEGVPPAGVGLVWMDVEGHEHQALAGAPGLLAAGIPLVVEARGRTGAELARLLAGRYERFVDLRGGGEHALGSLEHYLGSLPETAGRSFTDVLFT